ncbi:zinc ribbon domain-containing protein [Dickeya dianthicola]|uniref:zinc ribbon domain-containing protein n=1 Tax=Dickeya dianthicola TaxID=204039 RepID=UPI001F607305|nr:zinc ribbon domain-containing protein [Dickeya dianthicola]MCI4202745.1 zinc ribbon domain-containing protein [Dickeya dianthicola]MCI4210899.1 zinc ribbon domain-containing protein [Dickeya dianthicola]MCI4217752.1 zinc ribbon domain-containing protein [Dickeya dianthicola]MCI4226156.1 zinc ribbon domain-containing protein [Dickeya dianthicola]
MALVNCTECGKEVSDTALKCPSCGKQLRKPKRSFFGKIIKWVFILFNIFMIYSVFAGLGGSGEVINNATSEAERAGAAIGTGIGVMMLGSVWVIGDIIIGILVFLTRPKG